MASRPAPISERFPPSSGNGISSHYARSTPGCMVLYTVRDLENWSAAGERKSTRDKTAGTVFPARPLTPEERGDC